MSQAVPLAPPKRLVDVEIDGKPVRVPEDATLLEACRSEGIDTPTLCYLETLTPGQWDAPTLCAKWKVRDVVGHLVEGANKIAMSKMMGGMLKSGFNLNKMFAATAIEEGKKCPLLLDAESDEL